MRFGKISLKKAGAIVGALAAAGSLIGLFITVDKRMEEKSNLAIEIDTVDLIEYIPESQQDFLQKTLNELVELEGEYRAITGDSIILVGNALAVLIQNSNEVSVKHAETGAETANIYDDFTEALDESIKSLGNRKSSATDELKPKHDELIARLKEMKTKLSFVKPNEKISLTARVENRSRLSNYVSSQGVLVFFKDEENYSEVPQIVMEIADESTNPEAGKVEGYGVSSLRFESSVDNLEADHQIYVDFAFKGRSEGLETHNLIFALEDLNERLWYEQASFSTFTDRRIKRKLRGKVEDAFEKRNKSV